MSKAVRITVGLLVVLVAAGFVFSRLGARPISTDLSGVGQGKPALVVAYENYTPAGANALERLSGVRADYEDRMLFRVADLGTPDGRAFASLHRLSNGVAVFLGHDGERVRVTAIPASEAELREQLDRKLAAVGLAD